MGEKAEIQNDKLEEIKKEQLETKKAIIILKEQQKKTNQKLNELKVEQVKTNNSLNELRAEQIKANNSLNELRAEQAKNTDSVNITNKLLTELLNLKRDKLKNNNQNAITIPQNSSEQIKSVIEINETPRYINILKKPEEKSDEISFRSIINNLEISDASAKKKNIEVKEHKLRDDNHLLNNLEISDISEKKESIREKGYKLRDDNNLLINLEISDESAKKESIGEKGYKFMKDNKLEISDEREKKKNIREKGHKLMKNNMSNTNKISKINVYRDDNKKK